MGDSGERTEGEVSQNVANPVLIIGSGCTGLALAQGLKKAGIPVIVFEKRSALFTPGDRDWNMGLHWGMPILKSLLPESAVSQLQSVQTDPNTPTKPVDKLLFLNGSTGEVILDNSIEDFYRLRRSKLRRLLAQDVDIRWNTRLKNIVFEHDNKSVTAVFEDGQHITGRCIIGADGARSSVRHLILGPEAAPSTRLPYAVTFVQSKYTREQALFLRSFHPLYIASPHPDGYMAFFGLQDAPEVDKPEDWTFFFYISWNSTIEQQNIEGATFGNKERLAQVKELSKGFCDPLKSAFEWTPEDQPAWYFDLTVWDPSLPEHQWDNKNGRVTLAGDAAHPMTFQRGQGLNHAIASAGKLVQCITAEAKMATAIDMYEAEMKPRSGEEVRISVANTTMLHDWKKVMQSPVFKAGVKKIVKKDEEESQEKQLNDGAQKDEAKENGVHEAEVKENGLEKDD